MSERKEEESFCFPSLSGVLSADEIKERKLVIDAKENQYGINGVDLTVGKIFLPLDLPLGVKPTDEDYVKMPLILEDEDVDPYWIIPRGNPVQIEVNEIIDLSKSPAVLGYAVGRSSIHRLGAIVHGAFWDAGYVGRGKLFFLPMAGDFLLKKGDRFAQIAFWPANSNSSVYNGTYQKEGLKVSA